VAAHPPYLPPPSSTASDWLAASADEARRFFTGRDGLTSFQVRRSGDRGPRRARSGGRARLHRSARALPRAV